MTHCLHCDRHCPNPHHFSPGPVPLVGLCFHVCTPLSSSPFHSKYIFKLHESTFVMASPRNLKWLCRFLALVTFVIQSRILAIAHNTLCLQTPAYLSSSCPPWPWFTPLTATGLRLAPCQANILHLVSLYLKFLPFGTLFSQMLPRMNPSCHTGFRSNVISTNIFPPHPVFNNPPVHYLTLTMYSSKGSLRMTWHYVLLCCSSLLGPPNKIP